MVSTKNIKAGDQIGSLVVIDCLGPRDMGNRREKFYLCRCNLCKKVWEKSSTTLYPVLRGRGSGCHCAKRNNNPRSEHKKRYDAYVNAATKRGYEFELSFDEFVDLSSQNCYYCNSSPQLRPPGIKNWDFKFYMSGIDRYDNSKGYTRENSKPCCSMCNGAKLNHTPEEFYQWVNRIVEKYYKEKQWE